MIFMEGSEFYKNSRKYISKYRSIENAIYEDIHFDRYIEEMKDQMDINIQNQEIIHNIEKYLQQMGFQQKEFRSFGDKYMPSPLFDESMAFKVFVDIDLLIGFS